MAFSAFVAYRGPSPMAHTSTNRHVRGTFNKFPDFFVQAFKIVADS